MEENREKNKELIKTFLMLFGKIDELSKEVEDLKIMIAKRRMANDRG